MKDCISVVFIIAGGYMHMISCRFVLTLDMTHTHGFQISFSENAENITKVSKKSDRILDKISQHF